jgi:hypothetical protein
VGVSSSASPQGLLAAARKFRRGEGGGGLGEGENPSVPKRIAVELQHEEGAVNPQGLGEGSHAEVIDGVTHQEELGEAVGLGVAEDPREGVGPGALHVVVGEVQLLQRAHDGGLPRKSSMKTSEERETTK